MLELLLIFRYNNTGMLKVRELRSDVYTKERFNDFSETFFDLRHSVELIHEEGLNTENLKEISIELCLNEENKDVEILRESSFAF